MSTSLVHYVTFKTSQGTSRKLSVIDGVPFYCSSGENSHSRGTWFPFLGIETEGSDRGWFRKPGFLNELTSLGDTIPQTYNNHFPSFDIRKRFTSLKCLLISSLIGGGFWETENGKALFETLKQDHPQFYSDNAYILQDTGQTFNAENTPPQSVERTKIYRAINELLEKGAIYSLTSGFDAKLFYQQFVDVGYAKDNANPLQSNVITLFKPTYPQYPKTLSPALHEEMKWPNDYQKSLAMSEEQKIETEEFIRLIYPIARKNISTNPKYLDYELCYAEPINGIYQNCKTHVNIDFLHNGEIIVYPDNLDIIYENKNKNTLIFKVYNLSRGEWMVLKNSTLKSLIPYLKQLSENPHIAKIYDFCGFRRATSQIGKLYDKNLTQLIMDCKSTPMSAVYKEKLMVSLLKGMEAIHKTPYKFSNTEGFLFHADIKLDNIFFDKAADDVVIGDLGEIGKWDFLTSSSGYMPPELALEILKLEAMDKNNYSNNHIITFNKKRGPGIDIWNLGLVFAGLLQGEVIKHKSYAKDVYFPQLNFILDRLQRKEHEQTYLGEMASLEQDEIDEEICQIKQRLPQTEDGQKLRRLWDVVHQMLQVSPSKRLSASQLMNQLQSCVTNASVKQISDLGQPIGVKRFFPPANSTNSVTMESVQRQMI
jgi:serine/threonine protein kinase